MADEPNKRMDETLKAYAGQRRQQAGAPFELHPATRQILRGEVARTYKQASRGSWVQRMLAVWPRVAFATACVAITVTLVLVMLPRQRVVEMAQRTPLADEAVRDERIADKEQEKLVRGYGDAPAPTSSTAPVMPPAASQPVDRLAKRSESDNFKAKSEVMEEVRKDTDSVRLLREESAAKEIAATRAYRNINVDAVRERYVQKNQSEDGKLGVRLQDAQQTTRENAPQNAQTVLNNFELEQKGDAVRVIDADGSVYVGNVLSLDEAKKRSFAIQNSPVGAQGGAGGTAAPAESQVMFYAIGTNVSLRQKVSIEANIVQVQLETNAVAARPAAAPAPAQLPAQNQRIAGQTVSPLNNTIRGRARVGTNQEMFFEAVPTKP